MTDAVQAELQEAFDAAGVSATFHAVALGTDREVEYRSDEPSIMASVFKVPVLIALVRAADEGRVDLSQQVTVPVAGRAFGPTGLSIMTDPVTMSLCDLARSMMVVSDNAATDVVVGAVGLAAIADTLQQLGLDDTRVVVDVGGLFASMLEDAGGSSLAALPQNPSLEELLALRAFRPAETNATTPRDMTRLLAQVAEGAAASREGCELVMTLLHQQVWPHRLAAGFPEDDILVGGKTGTLPRIRNEVGLVTYPDGQRYAVACFTWAQSGANKNPAADAVIGTAARLAVSALRRTA